MNEIFGYCGWDFGKARNNKFQRGEQVRIGRNIYRVIFRIGSWHLLKRLDKQPPLSYNIIVPREEQKGIDNYEKKYCSEN